MNYLLLAQDLFQKEEVVFEPLNNPLNPEWIASYVVVGIVFLGIILFSYKTQAGVIARATTKEAVRQPIFWLLIGVGIVFMLLNTFLPFFTFGEDVKMLVDCGLATILITGALMAVWTSSTSIASEIEGKTAMTLLSKPINRRQFVLGKYVGILTAVFWMLLIPIGVFLWLILYKIGYDAKEAAKDIPTMAERIPIMVKTLPGLALILLEISVLAAVSVAISTRLPMVVNIVTTFAIFVIGHLTPVLVKGGVVRNEFVEFMARLIATILPSLEVFNMEAAVATGAIVPPEYLLWALVYCMAYCAAAILLAFLLFEDRDLA
jgi:ABC-type transport system involved in multi-copper enzyme maturation permease subunit